MSRDHLPQSNSPTPGGRSPSGKKKRSPVFTVILVLLGLTLLGGLCCVGGGFFLYSQSDFEFEEDPERAAARASEVIEIELMEGLEPKSFVNMDMMVMKMIVIGYEGRQGEFLLIGEVEIFGDDGQAEKEFRESLTEDQGEIQVEEMETREFEIRGEMSEFQFVVGTNNQNGARVREINGVFQGKIMEQGIMTLRIPEEAYDEAAVVKMIESIR